MRGRGLRWQCASAGTGCAGAAAHQSSASTRDVALTMQPAATDAADASCTKSATMHGSQPSEPMKMSA